MDYIDKVFGDLGVLSKTPSYEKRKGQLDYTRAVEAAISSNEHLLLEGPCGTGKTFGYLVPATYHASKGKKVVLATHTINLQRRLVEQDLQFLSDVLPWKFNFGLLKGRANYICKQRVETYRTFNDLGVYGNTPSSGYGLTGQDYKEFCSLMAWSRVCQSGDREDINIPFVKDRIFRKLSVSGKECLGKQCPLLEECFYEEILTEAKKKNIIVVNYHILFADLVSKSSKRRGILPKYDVLILDEAHHIPEVARSMLGSSLHAGVFNKLVSILSESEKAKVFADPIIEESKKLFRALGRKRSVHDKRYTSSLGLDWKGLSAALDNAYSALTESPLKDNVQDLSLHIQECFESPKEDFVYWVDPSITSIESRPLNIAPYIQSIFDTATTVMTSATLRTGRSFDPIKKQLGNPDLKSVAVESPFGHSRQARLIIGSRQFLVPTATNQVPYNESTISVYQDILKCWAGRLLILCTRTSDMDWLHSNLETERPVQKQGDDDRNSLVDWLTQTHDAILIGVTSFWEGIDIPGNMGVVIHKLPFTPFDPLVSALKDYMGELFWSDYYIPDMITKLQQMVGRLIRKRSDRGFVVIMDRRCADYPYAQRIMASLPFGGVFSRTEDIATIGKFMEGR